MALKGDLASVDLAQVFQMLVLNQKQGLLGIQAAGAWKALYFDHRGVTLYFNEHAMLDRVLTRHFRSGATDADGLQEAHEHASRHGQTVVDAVLAGGYLTEDELDEGLRDELEEDIYELFFWGDARFEFFEGVTELEDREGSIHDRYFFGPDTLIMEAARRMDEWSYIKSRVPSGSEILRHVVEHTHVLDLDQQDFQVFELLDGKRDVDRVIEVTGIPPFQVFKALSAFLDQGLVEAVPEPELATAGEECMREGRTQDAINLFERALQFDAGLPQLHTLASQAYEAAGDYQHCAYHTKCVAEIRAEDGDLRGAIDLFRWVLETIPTDLHACQRIVELSVGRPDLATDDFDPLQVGKELVDLYLEIGEVERLRVLLEGLLRENPCDIDLKKRLIEVHTKAGDKDRVVELYESISEDLITQGNPIQAIKYLQMVVQSDRSRRDLSERIKLLYRVDERDRRRRRSLLGLGAAFCALVAGALGYYVYNNAARSAYDELGVQSLVDAREFRSASLLVERFIGSYPFTMAAKDAEADLLSLGAQREASDARAEREAKQLSAERARIRYEYQAIWRSHIQAFENRDLTNAISDIGRVRELVAEAGQPEDLQWEVTNKVVESFRDLRKYLARAAALERAARAALDAGDWRLARTSILELVSEFGMSEQARLARIPVMCATRPPGATIRHLGKPLTRLVDGQPAVMRTPAVVLCPNEAEVSLEFRLPGFDPQVVGVRPLEVGSVRPALIIQPHSFKFSHSAHAEVGVGSTGAVSVGLRGGRLGIQRPQSQPVSIKLSGLREVDGRPCVTSREVICATNDNTLLCYRLQGAEQLWSLPINHSLSAPLVLANGRVFLVDGMGRVSCVSALEGRELWTESIDGRASGRPTIHGRSLTIGSLGGQVLVLDAQDGRVLQRIVMQSAVSTRVVRTQSLAIFGTEDGLLHAYRVANKTPEWTLDVGRAIRRGEVVMSTDMESVIVVGADNTLVRVRCLDGEVQDRQVLEDRICPGLVTCKGRLFVVVREAREKNGVEVLCQDLLLAFDEQDLMLQWQFRDGGEFKGPLTVGANRVLLTGSKGEVFQFR